MTVGGLYLIDPHPTLETGVRDLLGASSSRLNVSRAVPESNIDPSGDQVVFAVEDIASDFLRRWSDLIDQGPIAESIEDWASTIYQPGFRRTIETIETGFRPSRTKIVASSSFPNRQFTAALEHIASFLRVDPVTEVGDGAPRPNGRPYTLDEAETLQRLRSAEVDPVWLREIGDSVTGLFPEPRGATRLPTQIIDILTDRFLDEVAWMNDHLEPTPSIEIHRGPPLADLSWGSDHYSLAASLAVEGRSRSAASSGEGI